MPSLNRVTIVGHLGRDPECKATQGGGTVCNMSIATSETWTDKATGQKQEHTEWHRVVVWGKTAELCGKFLAKGKIALVEGKIRSRKYQDKAGVEKISFDIIADRVLFLSGKAPATDAPTDPVPADDSDVPF